MTRDPILEFDEPVFTNTVTESQLLHLRSLVGNNFAVVVPMEMVLQDFQARLAAVGLTVTGRITGAAHSSCGVAEFELEPFTGVASADYAAVERRVLAHIVDGIDDDSAYIPHRAIKMIGETMGKTDADTRYNAVLDGEVLSATDVELPRRRDGFADADVSQQVDEMCAEEDARVLRRMHNGSLQSMGGMAAMMSLSQTIPVTGRPFYDTFGYGGTQLGGTRRERARDHPPADPAKRAKRKAQGAARARTKKKR